MFQSTRPYGARRGRSCLVRGLHGFNPRARMGRDLWRCPAASQGRVSIHAPVWGATAEGFQRLALHAVSIHAPVWGATMSAETNETNFGFQSTRPYGARRRAPGRS